MKQTEMNLAPVVGVRFMTEKPTAMSPLYEVRDRNMRLTLAVKNRPHKLEVPTGGSVWERFYEAHREQFLTYAEMEEKKQEAHGTDN